MSNTGLEISDITKTSAVITWNKSDCPPSDYDFQYTLIGLPKCQADRVEADYGSKDKDDEATISLDNLFSGSAYEVRVSSVTTDGSPRRLSTMGFVTLEDGKIFVKTCFLNTCDQRRCPDL